MYSHIMGQYSVIKRSKVLIHVIRRTDFKGITILNEKSKTQKDMRVAGVEGGGGDRVAG